jgi:cobalt/nickel transport system permease protein
VSEITLDPYIRGSSLIHGLDPRVKIVLTFAYVLTTALTPAGAWPGLLLLLATGISASILAELPARTVLARVLLALPFALAALPLLVTLPGTPLLHLPWGWTVTREGAIEAATIAAKSSLSVQISVVLTATTPVQHLLAALRALKLPRLLVAILGLMWRYLFVLVDEAQRLMRARASRSAGPPAAGSAQRAGGPPGGSVLWRAQVTGGMAGNLLLRGLERADRTYDAMCARGYDGELRSLPLPPITAAERATLVIGCTVLGLLALTGMLMGG